MYYIIALLCPPLACLMVGRFWASVLNFAMCCTIILGPLAMIHAWYVVRGSERAVSPTVNISIAQRNPSLSRRSGAVRRRG